MKQKYVRLKQYDSFIFFPAIIEHSTFLHLDPVSAGFYHIENNTVKCYGNSYSLGMSSMDDDSLLATKQVFGIDAMITLMNNEK